MLVGDYVWVIKSNDARDSREYVCNPVIERKTWDDLRWVPTKKSVCVMLIFNIGIVNTKPKLARRQIQTTTRKDARLWVG